MPTGQMNEVIQYLRTALLLPEGTDRTDGQLLECFVSRREPAALEALVRRHGPMVWGVCLRALRNHHDAEDAFQAAFLVLVRKAASIYPRAKVGNWLYGVAHQTAIKARATRAKRRVRERSGPEMPEPAVAEQDLWSDLQPLLDQEVSRLPEKYRTVIVLRELEGKTGREAARQLGLPEGTVASRLARARAMLAKRLTRPGLSVSGGTLAAVLSQNAAACVPTSVMSSTIKVAMLVAAGEAAATGLISAQVATLSEGVVKTMLLKKLKTVTAAMLVLGLAAFGGGLYLHEARAQQGPLEVSPAVPEKNAKASETAPQAAEKPKDAPMKVGEDTGKPILSLPGHTDRLTSVACSPDGTSIATASWDGTIRLWNPKSGKEVRRLDVPAPRDYNPAHLSRILFSPDNEYVVVAQQAAPNEPGVIVWNRRTGERVREFPGQCVALAPDGKHIACGGWGTTDSNRGDIRLYEFATGKLVREMHTHYSRIDLVTFSPDGQTLFSQVGIPRPPLGKGIQRLGRDGAQVRAWDLATGKELKTGLEGAWNEHRIAISPDGRTLALASSLREIATGGQRANLTGHTSDVCGVAFSADGRTLASGSMDGTVRLWDLPSGKEIGRFGKEVDPFKGGWVLAVAFSPDGRSLVSGGLNKTADIWDVSRITGRPRLSAERAPADLEADWKDLAGDAAAGYGALGRLVLSPERAVPFLGKRLQNTDLVDIKRIERLIADLDDERFEVRDQANTELEALAERAALALRKALARKPSPEAKRRLRALLDRLDGVSLSAATVRQLRAVEALESIGNAETRHLLDKLAVGHPEVMLTQEAKAAAERLAK